LDPQLTNDGKPYGPYRYKQIVKECYLISKNVNTSYIDVMKMTPQERNYLLEFIAEEIQRKQELTEQVMNKSK
jgi:hypothetical protein